MPPLNLDSPAAARLADDVEAQAFEAMFEAAPEPLRERLGLRVARVADAALLTAPALPTPMFNRAIGLGLREPATLGAVEAIREHYRHAGIQGWWLHWNPHAAPSGFAPQLHAQGFTTPQRSHWAKMLRSTEAPPAFETTLHIEEARGEQAFEVARIAVRAFEMPPFMADWLGCMHGDGSWRMYALMDGASVVGGGCLYLAADVAWLGVAAVAPSHRGRRGQAALISHRIAQAAAAGARWVVTETGEPTAGGEANPSLENMRRCGFTQVASRLNFAPPA